MLNIRGMSIVENFLTGVNRFGHGLTPEVSGAGHRVRCNDWLGMKMLLIKAFMHEAVEGKRGKHNLLRSNDQRRYHLDQPILPEYMESAHL